MGSLIEGYDERQVALRHKFGFQAFFLLMVLTGLNAFVCDIFYVWGEQTVMSFCLILAATYYFGIRTVFSGAYTGDARSEKRTAFMIPAICGVNAAVLLMTLAGIARGGVALFEDGKATISFISLVSNAIFIPFFIAYIIRRGLEKREERA